jgi:ABC-type multidrug transport system ATPase subunit
MLVHTGEYKEGLGYYFKNKNGQPILIMQYLGIVLWGFILFLIENLRLVWHRSRAKSSFSTHEQTFKEQKALRPISDEAVEMEREVGENRDWAIRVVNVSRLFINIAGKPVCAVNQVSLGVKEGTTFGFLGANGAGKTTLIQMITGQLPVSNGKIEITGNKQVETGGNSSIVSVCPQFNTHLTPELTPAEHFGLYTLLFQKLDDEKKVENLMEALGMNECADTPVRDLSEGECRKLAIALSFLGPAKIILLDEPTATLDATSRRNVYDLITRYKGIKTFMLCTHLLSEAEFLCDNISIMVKGCVYSVGTPQYLSRKFGTDYKIDVMLAEDSIECRNACTSFMTKNIPNAVISIEKPMSRIYSIPAKLIRLPDLFEIMETGMQDRTNGIAYYSCSSSSLETVFMEIVRLSSAEDADESGSSRPKKQPKKQKKTEDPEAEVLGV